ncbi:MAG: hypothetical protein LBL83_11395 [Clostridiales bacterium]|jgi:hypothetical protein|nr:hypothetical protein [Clostridiales bacterium]
MKYMLKARNPKTGKIERYEADIADAGEIPPILDLWKNGAGYEILSFGPAAKEGECATALGLAALGLSIIGAALDTTADYLGDANAGDDAGSRCANADGAMTLISVMAATLRETIEDVFEGARENGGAAHD